MSEGQRSVIGEIAGRRKRRREVNRKLRKETIALGKIVQTGSAGSVGGGGGGACQKRNQIQRDLPH